MKKGKLIIIEGTDCSGKETQTKILIQNLKKKGVNIENFSFPMYDTATGKIVGVSYLGKNYISEKFYPNGLENVDKNITNLITSYEGFFPEKASNVPAKVASLYYAADRFYNIDKIKKELDSGNSVILDRYSYSNMAHQGGKLHTQKEREELFRWIEKLEFDLLELPKPDLVVFLHLPAEAAVELREKRIEKADQHEDSLEHLKNAENTYLELAKLYNFTTVECVKPTLRTIDDISKEVFEIVNELFTPVK